MTFSIRRASVEDAFSIASVQAATWKTTYRTIIPDEFLDSMDVEAGSERWAERIGEGQATILVAENSSSLFGFAAGGKLRETIDGYDAELYAIYLLKDRQRRGAGRGLVQKLVEELRAAQLSSMIVWVLAQNPAVEFYKRLGAVPVAEKTIDIGGRSLQDLAFGWPDLSASF
jgi:ribosomal protein S18 acetylase RimI-like enzyme